MNTALIILAAGFATRARDINQNRQKCLLRYDGKTLLENNIEAISRQLEIKQLIIGLGFDAETVKEFCLTDLNISNITFNIEPLNEIVSTGQTFKKCFQLLDNNIERVIVSFSDYYYFNLHTLQCLNHKQNSLGLFKDLADYYTSFSGNFKNIGVVHKNVVSDIIKNQNGIKTFGFTGLFSFTDLKLMKTILKKKYCQEYTFDMVNNYVKVCKQKIDVINITHIIDFGDYKNYSLFLDAVK